MSRDMPGGMTEGQWADYYAGFEVTSTRIESGDSGPCEICETHSKRVKHHISYNPEETIKVCKSCHWKIHNLDSFHPDLTPNEIPEERQWEQ